MTLICVPITVESLEQALAESAIAAEHGADLVELRIDDFFISSEALSDANMQKLATLIGECDLPSIVTCRHTSEGGASELSSEEVVTLYEQLCALPRPPRYVDIELARIEPVRDRLEAIARHSVGVIVSMHDFQGRPADLSRRLSSAYSQPCATVVKVAYRARSLRDNLELFEILRDAPKPTIALGMGEFGLMSRVLAPKFGGLLTFASLRDSAATAPGQPTLDDLLRHYRFGSIKPSTKVYGIIGWPVAQSMSPLVHNAGFEALGFDGVYLPMPVAADANNPDASDASFKATLLALAHWEPLHLAGASVTIPHKHRLAQLDLGETILDEAVAKCRAANTLALNGSSWRVSNTDQSAAADLLHAMGNAPERQVAIVGAGGVAAAIAFGCAHAGSQVTVYNRDPLRAQSLAQRVGVLAKPLDELASSDANAFINATPVGMKAGPDPDGLSIPVHELAGKLPPETVFFDTVYNPIETPMLKAAKAHGYRTIDGVQMFVAQAEAQFNIWTGHKPPEGLFDRLVRDRLATDD